MMIADVPSPPPGDASASRALIPLWLRRADARVIKESIARSLLGETCGIEKGQGKIGRSF